MAAEVAVSMRALSAFGSRPSAEAVAVSVPANSRHADHADAPPFVARRNRRRLPHSIHSCITQAPEPNFHTRRTPAPPVTGYPFAGVTGEADGCWYWPSVRMSLIDPDPAESANGNRAASPVST